MRRVIGLLGVVTGLVVPALVGLAPAWAVSEYEETAVSNSGAITGSVTLTGSIPEPRIFPLVLYPFGPFCKKISDGQGHVEVDEFIVSPNRGLQDTIVAVQRVTHGKPFPRLKQELVAVDCMFHPAETAEDDLFAIDAKGKLHHEHPLVMVLRNHQPISVVNRDPIIHNGQVFQNEKGNIILNFPLPVSEEPRGGILQFDEGKRVSQMICGMHEFMQAWGFVVDNPYYARTKKDGKFTIDGLPPGTYRVTAWHPHLPIVEREVTVPANGTASFNVEFDGARVVRPAYESQERFRIGPEAHPHDNLEECTPPYCEE
ncbi:MAG: carboxypeptidase-like regulatory domain-containing protein [Nitrospirota bacterium]